MVTALEATRLIEAFPEDVGLSSSRLENVSRLVQRYIDDRKLPGAITMIARRGKVVHFETYGNMDDEAAKPMSTDAIFRLASMTKPIASVALMSLYEEGKFQLDDPASKFIAEFKELKVFARGTAESYEVREPIRVMTIRDLLMHTSGLMPAGPAGAPAATAVGQLYQKVGLQTPLAASLGTLADLITKLAGVPLHYDPGSQWIYGFSTDIIGYLCEVMSGTSFDRFLQERIFSPLRMEDTSYSVPESKLHRFAAGYRRGGADEAPYVLSDTPIESRFAKPTTYFSGAGGLVSTASDYMRFCKMLANGGELGGERILGPRTLRLMTMNHLPGGGDLASMNAVGAETIKEGIGFGLGFAVLLDPTVAQTMGTPGEYYWGGASSTAFFVSPSEDLIMIFLTQLSPSSSYPIRRELRAVTYQAIID